MKIKKIIASIIFAALITGNLFLLNANAQDGAMDPTEESVYEEFESAEEPAEEFADAEIGPDIEHGRRLFSSQCASCHGINRALIGPKMYGSEDNWENRDDLYRWVRNSQELIREGHPYAVQIFEEWNRSVMPAFPLLSNDDIDAIFAYVEHEATYVPDDVALDIDLIGVPADDAFTTTFLIVLVIVLIFTSLILYRITIVLDRLAKEKEGEPIPVPVPFYKSKKLAVTIGLVVIIFLGYNVVDGAINLGRQQGYAPTQPIKFSHALHAGVHQIDCQYCHGGAAKGKHANIPDVSLCMNCHAAIKEGPEYGETEIAKLIEYWETGTPIKWVRIHNLPDHVYFNHAQHVNVAGLDCQSCHGPVEEMDVLYQHASLSMGWCIDCHRTYDADFQNNEYYEIYERYHQELKSGDRTRVTVEQIGGTDCQSCHY
ncbi:MAG: cytochrome C [Chitinophagaceae bacterium]|nr:MAG: cytochrome C [Chitinophagaceae bacterium]